ncbi:MAG: zinc ribbon domain-containing protein [Terriglobales bacterium]|jgi:putative FmdB family regulatory protein
MPLYEYQCKKCGHRLEKIQQFSDKPLTKCPECGGALEKLISQSSVQFKGSGWYVSDYGRKGSSAASSSSSSDSESDTKSATAAKESKETKKEDKPKPDTSKKHKKD